MTVRTLAALAGVVVLAGCAAPADTALTDRVATPLHFASMHGRRRVAQLLLSSGSWVDAGDRGVSFADLTRHLG